LTLSLCGSKALSEKNPEDDAPLELDPALDPARDPALELGLFPCHGLLVATTAENYGFAF